MVGAVISAVAPVVGATTGAIHLFVDSAAGGYLQMLPGSFGAPDDVTASSQVPMESSASSAARVFATGEPYVSNSPGNDPTTMQPYIRAMGIERVLHVRLRVGDRRIGVLHVANKPTDFSPADLARMDAVAPVVASAVDHMRLILELRAKEALESALRQVATGIAAGESIEHFAATALRQFSATLDGSLLVLSLNGQRRVVVTPTDDAPTLSARFLDACDLLRVKPSTELTRPQYPGDTGSATIHMPVLVSGAPVATLSIRRSRGEPLSAMEHEALERLAAIAALSWVTAEYQRRRSQIARDRERQRIADDLHDHVAQLLFATKTRMEVVIENQECTARVRTALEQCREQVTACELAIREVVDTLSPALAASNDLDERFALMAQGVEDEFDIAIEVRGEASDTVAASGVSRPHVSLAMRAAREALVNAAKHAGPCRITARMQFAAPDELLIIIRDAGKGIAPEVPKGYGLLSVQRALESVGGRLEIAPHRDGGTEVLVAVPLDG